MRFPNCLDIIFYFSKPESFLIVFWIYSKVFYNLCLPHKLYFLFVCRFVVIFAFKIYIRYKCSVDFFFLRMSLIEKCIEIYNKINLRKHFNVLMKVLEISKRKLTTIIRCSWITINHIFLESHQSVSREEIHKFISGTWKYHISSHMLHKYFV